jgi:1-hydroxy-2-naphthoate dioxygenase
MADDPIKAFDEKLAKANIYGQWITDPMLQNVLDGPRPAGDPYLWRWKDTRALLEQARSVMPESYTARRSLMFNNPGLAQRGTTHTLAMGMQLIQPGEIAWAHRHSATALRFTIEGSEDLYTVVDGEVSSALNQAAYDPYGDDRQPLRDEVNTLTARLGALRPAWESTPEQRVPVRYAWKDAEAQLKRLSGADGSPYDGVALEYVNPLTGGPTLPTLSCWVHWLKPGQETVPHRRTSSAVYYVIRGEGRTMVDETELTWGPRDGFCVPNWSWHHHVNLSATEEAVLFSVHDTPAIKALGLYIEEPENSLGATPLAPVPGDLAKKG